MARPGAPVLARQVRRGNGESSSAKSAWDKRIFRFSALRRRRAQRRPFRFRLRHLGIEPVMEGAHFRPRLVALRADEVVADRKRQFGAEWRDEAARMHVVRGDQLEGERDPGADKGLTRGMPGPKNGAVKFVC